jgi:hypothetical protein
MGLDAPERRHRNRLLRPFRAGLFPVAGKVAGPCSVRGEHAESQRQQAKRKKDSF